MRQFIDTAHIRVTAGHGGRGCRSFHRAGRGHHRVPDGGDGGPGGDVIFVADSSVMTLLDCAYRKHYRAGHGHHGGSNLKQGGRGSDCIVPVPAGTLVRNAASGVLLRDLARPGDRAIIAKGGRGGRGNITSADVGPGIHGAERVLDLELKLLADVGLVGLPNAGKSSLLRRISRATPRVAAYPFTTIAPMLGVVASQDAPLTFTACDIPGLIAGAHAGKGLGLTFLRHVERTGMLLYVIDMAGSEGRHPWNDFQTLQAELLAYGHGVAAKPRMIVANKMDLPSARKHLREFRQSLTEPVQPISSLTGDGIPSLVQAVGQQLKAVTDTSP